MAEVTAMTAHHTYQGIAGLTGAEDEEAARFNLRSPDYTLAAQLEIRRSLVKIENPSPSGTLFYESQFTEHEGQAETPISASALANGIGTAHVGW